MRNSNLLKWAQSKQNDKGNRNWIHPPDALQKGHIAYLVKFMGNTEVDQPKGIDIVKEGIRKLKFNQQLKKAEGTKIPKVELTISIDGVAIQEPKTKRIMHQYPLHRISYCADDKGEKKFFSFIAKDCPDSERHMCFVFVSDKLAEEITLTIGQAFDLAYKRFVETSGKDLEVQRRVMLLQQRVKQLENESSVLRQRLSDVLNGQASDLDSYMRRNKITNMLVVAENDNISDTISTTSSNGIINNDSTNGLLLNLNENNTAPPPIQQQTLPPVPPRSFEKNSFISDAPTVGTKLEGLLLDELDDDFNPRANEVPTNGVQKSQTNLLRNNNGPPPLLAPPPKTNNARKIGATNSVSNSSTPVTAELDPFGMDDFGNAPLDIENAIGILDKKILEMKDGFSRGLSFGNEDFSIESLDPLRK
ncbi:hypothetical protein O3M35_010717 [Rhynocoris fuscipes]|uniref:PID domain-containing protein n=1 Tax=Rhynocoris fuscipes TaxID=488301 RepID=A0AAW1D3P5_9HEMI